MQTFTQKWCLVNFLEPVAVDTQFSCKNWPPHITIADTFAIDITPEMLHAKLLPLVSGIKSFTLTADKDAYWGDNAEIHVMTMNMSSDIVDLHKLIFESLKSNGAVFNDEQFQNDGYIAHTTLHDNHSIDASENYAINAICLINMFPQGDALQRKVMWTITLPAK